jgi:cytoplasmic iron level regulating protein YaaA (DUF328/UPF0246 family)
VLILLPPSEGKSAPSRGRPLDLDRLDLAELAPARRQVLDALVGLCTEDPARAAEVLGLGPTQADLVAANAALADAPTARADRIYTGVLYDALDLASLDGAARSRATRRLAIMSSAFGVVRPGDRIPAYRLSGDTNLPGIGTVSTFWRTHLDRVLTAAAGSGLVVDLRSGTYGGFWHPAPAAASRVATVRVLHEQGGTRKVVSHFNKATKGRIVRDLLVSGANPRNPAALAAHLRELDWEVEEEAGPGTTRRLDVVVREL